MAAQADERGLVEAARANPLRFAELYELHFDRIYAYVARRLRDRAATEDVTADVFHQALAGLSRYEWRGAPFAAWLYKIAANEIADRRRNSGRETEIDAEGIASAGGVEEAERSARLFGWVGELPDDQRRVIEMRFAEGWSVKEIAAELGRSEGAVKQLQFRGLHSLRARMGEFDA